MNLRKKLLLVFMVLASLVGVIGYFAIKSLKEVSRDVDQIRLSSILEVESSVEMTFELLLLNNLLKEYLSEKVNQHGDKANKIKKEIETSFANFEKAFGSRKRITTDGLSLYHGKQLEYEKGELAEIIKFETEYIEYKQDIINALTGFEDAAYIALFKKYEYAWDEEVRILMQEAKSFQQEALEEINNESLGVAIETKRSSRVVIIVAILSFIAALIIGIFGAKSVVAPLLKLKAATHNIAEGKLEIIKDINTKDEIGELAASFNIMTRELEKSRTQVEEYNKMLEQKVYERTKELEENIRKLKVTEEQLKKYADELESTNSELEQFAYVASHDLQEPLRTILSFVELFQAQYQGKLDTKADKYLTYILQSSGRMKVLIHDLMDYSRIGNKKELEKIDCNIILQEVKDDMYKTITEEQAVIEITKLPVIKGYPTEIKLLFQNLIANAIKFRKKGIIPHINISATQDNASWTFGVQDNGIGIAKEHKERIFTIFQRLHNKTEYEGSGIGLAHCKKIIGLHRGKIWTESIPGQGTTFYINIPKTRD